MGENSGGVEQTGKDKAGNRGGKTVHSRENRSSKDGEGTIDKSRVDSQAKKKLIIGSWNVCGFAAEERKRLGTVEQVCNRDLDIVGIQESWEKDGGGIGCKGGEYAWIGKKREGAGKKNRGARGLGFLVNEYLCGIIEVIEDTKFDESIWLRVPGERRVKYFFLGNMYMPPESMSTVKEMQKFREISVDVQKYKRQGEVVLVGDFNPRIGKASNPNENIGQYGEETKNKNGAEMMEFLMSNEMKTLNDRVKKAVPEWTTQCIKKGGIRS